MLAPRRKMVDLRRALFDRDVAVRHPPLKKLDVPAFVWAAQSQGSLEDASIKGAVSACSGGPTLARSTDV
eukprot:CAMPEP_0184227572 /NCGR_PEP_ID=MMETSP0976-20121227/21318_1 /TAXON_ID=483370 /ORGANISM="non described non described, Strain CCMP2097" /LENGTH=69 /DNA_ID=CAMNT_0026532519 /DNA_START=1 /DNA_END=207 /DNA_ORIENTATION=-